MFYLFLFYMDYTSSSTAKGDLATIHMYSLTMIATFLCAIYSLRVHVRVLFFPYLCGFFLIDLTKLLSDLHFSEMYYYLQIN